MQKLKNYFISKNILNKANFHEISENDISEFYSEWSNLYKKTYNKFPKKFFSDNPIVFFCGNEYKRINSYLRYGCLNDDNAQKDAEQLCNIIYTAPKFPQNAILYRGIQKDELKYYKQNWKRSDVAQIKSFLSTSISKEGTQKKSDYEVLLKIYLPKDSPAIYIDNIQSRNEKEVLLAPGGQLNLLSYKYKDKEIHKPTYDCYLSY